MGRNPRVERPHGAWHVWSRGVDRMPIVADDIDRANDVILFATAAERFEWRVLSYCLMTSHFHLVLVTPKPTLSAGMHWLKATIAREFNRRNGRTGPLFEKRFDAEPVEGDPYLMEVCRYVVLNPVRAGAVDHPTDWPWSSYAATARGDASTFVAVDDVLPLFDPLDRERAARAYRAFVADGIGRRRAA